MYDVIIAGGGISGLSAALILGRCRRKVLVCDSGKPRNAASRALHGFLSRDGTPPMQLRAIAREELRHYPSVTFLEQEVIDAVEVACGYDVSLADGQVLQARYLVVATGVVDRLPDLPGVLGLYGTHVFHCPYCDGWEVRDQPLAVYGGGETGYENALELTSWSRDVILCTDGGEPLSHEQLEHLARNGVSVRHEQIEKLESAQGEKMVIWFRNGSGLVRRAFFFNPLQYQASPLAERLGCTITEGGVVKVGKLQRTQPRLFVVGDAARSVQFAVVAAAEGAEAAFAINTALQKETIL